MSNLYSVEVMICATAYIKAGSGDEALKIAAGLKDDSLELLEQDGEVPISGKRFGDRDLPSVSLSPAMTIHGLWAGAVAAKAE